MGDDVKRDPVSGRFLPGTARPPNSARNAGRLPNEAQLKLRAALIGVTSNGTLEKWIRAMKIKIEEGDLKATEFLFDRVIGKPIERMIFGEASDDERSSWLEDLRSAGSGAVADVAGETGDPAPTADADVSEPARGE